MKAPPARDGFLYARLEDAVADRSDLADQPLPDDVAAANWRQAEAWLDGEVVRLGREHAGLPP